MTGSRSSSKNVSQQKSGPWGGQQPFLKQIFRDAQDWYTSQQGGESGGSGALQGLGNTLEQQLGGGQQNPYLDQTFDRASDAVSQRFNENVIPGLNASFGSAGRTGGGLHAQSLADASGQYGEALGGLATDIYGGAYENDQNRQLGYAGLVPGYEQTRNRFEDPTFSNLQNYKDLISQSAIGSASGMSTGKSSSIGYRGPGK